MTTTPPERSASRTATWELLADPADLAPWFPDEEPGDPRFSQALAEASARFRGAVRHHVTQRAETVTLDGGGARTLRLPAVNVQAETVEVSVDQESIPVDVSADGMIARRDGRPFPDRLGSVLVHFTGGYPIEDVPQDIQEAVLDQAKAVFVRRAGVNSMAMGSMSIGFAPDGVSQAWSDAVAAHRIRLADRA